jgi:hypothetical protein
MRENGFVADVPSAQNASKGRPLLVHCTVIRFRDDLGQPYRCCGHGIVVELVKLTHQIATFTINRTNGGL